MSEPRWTPGSLAQRVRHGFERDEEQQAAATAVERLTRAAREADFREGCTCGECAPCKLAAAVEAAERWQR